MRIHRSMQNKVIGGVCGGLAEILKVDAIYIRIAFVVFALSGGGAIIAYLALWYLLPTA